MALAPKDEFIREVDEEYRRDQMAQIWKRYSGLIIAVAILVVAGVGGWRYWQHRELTLAQEAASRYEDALQLARQDKAEDAEKALADIASSAPEGYALLSRFRLAAAAGGQNADEGAKAFDALAADPKVEPVWQDLARLRAAMLRMDGAEATAIRQALEPLAVPANAWRNTARELLGLSGLKAGDMDYAGRWFDQIAADPEAPAALRQRLEIYTALVAGGPVQATQ
jgi:hypothetical protein